MYMSVITVGLFRPHPCHPILCLSLGACSWVPKGDGKWMWHEDRGVASWYGEQFHGRQAVTGELFDMDALTAAHRTMPLGRCARGQFDEWKTSSCVRITDRRSL